MNKIKILILAALASYFISGLLEHKESEAFSMDTLFTLAFLGYIWYVLRRKKETNGHDLHQHDNLRQQQEDEDEEKPEMIRPAPWEPKPYSMYNFLKSSSTGRIIQHKLPWSIVEQGKSVGYFRHVPIPAWIRTSDNRQADYAGIALLPPPEECVCLELPDQAELILPPGLIYAIRS